MIEDVETDRLIATKVRPIEEADFRSLGSGWRFDWRATVESAEVFKLLDPTAPDQILGLLALRRHKNYVEVTLMAGGHPMSKLPDPEDIDVFVGGVKSDPIASIETERIIEEYKKRPDHPLKVEEARRILAALGISALDYGIPDSSSLLEHWHACVADLRTRDSRMTNGTGGDKEGIGEASEAGPGFPRENQN